MQWGPETDAKLFMHVLTINKIKIDYQALAIAMGNDCTPKAIMHRIAKLRAQAAEHSTAASAESPGLALPTPAKRGPPMRCQNPSTPDPSASMNAAPISPTSTASSDKKAAAAISPAAKIAVNKKGGATAPTATTNGVKKTAPSAKKDVAAAKMEAGSAAGSKRTATGKAKGKGSPLKVETRAGEEEVETPSKKPKISGSGVGAKGGFGNPGLNANVAEHAGGEAV